MLISKSKSEGKVLLHPGAVLAAFVTAAFLLSIDESKAMTLENVLVEMLPREADSADKSDVPLQDSTFLVDRRDSEVNFGNRSTTFEGSGNHNALLGAVAIINKILSTGGTEANEDNKMD